MLRDRFGIYGLGVLLMVAGFVVAYRFVEPAPPSHVRMSTGSPTGAYFRFGQQYQAILDEQGVTLDVLASEGSVDNLSRLKTADDPVDIAFVQGGTGTTVPPEGLTALGSLYLEPFWVFTRKNRKLKRLADLAGRKIAVGGNGSGTRLLAVQLLAEDGVGPDDAELLPLSVVEGHEALGARNIDAVMAVGSPSATSIRAMLDDDRLRVMSFDRADAYALRNRFLSVVRLPRGSVDLAADVPATDVALIAPAATLVARDDLHPALVTLILQVATRVHGEGGLLEPPEAFPSSRFVEFELSPEAERFYKSGVPFLQRYLPFWAADLVDRLKIMLLPLITLALPLARILPPMYRWRVRSRIYRWYRDLLSIESQAYTVNDPRSRAGLRRRLDEIDREVQRLSVPLSYADNAYALRMHIGLVRDRLDNGPLRPSSGAS